MFVSSVSQILLGDSERLLAWLEIPEQNELLFGGWPSELLYYQDANGSNHQHGAGGNQEMFELFEVSHEQRKAPVEREPNKRAKREASCLTQWGIYGFLLIL